MIHDLSYPVQMIRDLIGMHEYDIVRLEITARELAIEYRMYAGSSRLPGTTKTERFPIWTRGLLDEETPC